MKIGRWEGNEIIYTTDVVDNSVNLIEDFDFAFDILGANMIIDGMIVTEAAVPDMTILISAGIAEDFTVGTFLVGEALAGTVTTSDPVNDRVDIVEVRRFIDDTTPATRQFKDPITKAITDVTIDTKTEYKTEIQVTAGTAAPSPVAPSVTAGWMKIAEILVPSSSLTVVDANIYNVDAEKSGDSNTNWTTDLAVVYRNGTISDMKTKIIDAEAVVALNTAHGSSNGSDHFNVLNSLKGVNHIVLTEYTTTTVPAIAANSQIEINGNIYTNPSEVAISGSTANTTWYDILLTPSGTTFTASFIARGTGVWSDSKQGLYSGNNKVVACVYRDGSGDFINKNILIINNRTIEIKIEIGAWNMDTNSTFTVAHGLPYIAPLNTIISIDGLIFGDDGASLASRILSSADISGVSYGSVDSSTVNISLSRRNAGVFDSVNYDSITQNRGILTVKYTV